MKPGEREIGRAGEGNGRRPRNWVGVLLLVLTALALQGLVALGAVVEPSEILMAGATSGACIACAVLEVL